MTDTGSENVVERVARAIAPIRAEANNYSLKRVKVMAIDTMLARAAIQAMREPTEAMQDAGAAATDIVISDDSADFYPAKTWRAMIDEALK